MLTQLNNFIIWLDDVVWGIPLIVLILSVGIYLTVRLGLLQIRHLPRALKYMVKNEEGALGSHQFWCSLALSTTYRYRKYRWVATALCAGGPGALFWMILAAFFGMATKYAEGLLAIKYRTIDEKGHVLGGPFYYIENGMGRKWRPLAQDFAFSARRVGLFESEHLHR